MSEITAWHLRRAAIWIPLAIVTGVIGLLASRSVDFAAFISTSSARAPQGVALARLVVVLVLPVAVGTALLSWHTARWWSWLPAWAGLVVGFGIGNGQSPDLAVLFTGVVVGWIALAILEMAALTVLHLVAGPTAYAVVRAKLRPQGGPATATQARPPSPAAPAAAAGAAVGSTVVLPSPPSDRHVLGITRYAGAGIAGWVTAITATVHTLLLGPTRAGKTTGALIPTVLSWAGPAVAASSKPDVFWASGAHRASQGQIHLLDVLGRLDPATLPANVHLVRWSPLRGSGDWDTARARAAALAGAAKASNVNDADHWRTQGEHIVAPLLHAAVLAGASMRDVIAWSRSAATCQPALAILKNHGAQEAATWLDGVLAQDTRHRDSVFATLASVLHVYAGRVLDEAAAAVESDWDPRAFLTSRDTVYIVAPLDAEADDPGPIVAGFLSELYGALTRLTDNLPSGHLAMPMLWALDEVTNICRLPLLPRWMSEATGRGLSCVLGIQDYAQLTGLWGEDGAAVLWSNCANKVAFPSISNPDTLSILERLGGDHEVHRTSRTQQGQAPTWGGGQQQQQRPDQTAPQQQGSTTTATQKESRWTANQIYSLEQGTCLVFRPDLAAPMHATQASSYRVEPLRTWAAEAWPTPLS